jgi:hypothetical protein
MAPDDHLGDTTKYPVMFFVACASVRPLVRGTPPLNVHENLIRTGRPHGGGVSA